MIEVAVEAARAAGEIQRRRYGERLAVRHKGPVDLVTEVDVACEEAIREVFARLAPGTAVLGEEGGLTGSGGELWVVDPLDGTTNYAHGFPSFCVSVAWQEAGCPRLGVVFDPLRDELFQAEAGKGASRNGAPLRVSPTMSLEDSLLATGFPYNRRTNPRNNLAAFSHLTLASQGVRRSGSAALDLAYVAAGRLDGFWEPGLKPWDLAAGVLLVVEAGGRVSGLGGEAFTTDRSDVVATNRLLHDQLLDALAGLW